MNKFVPFVLATAFIGAQLEPVPMFDQDLGQTVAVITTASSAAGMTVNDFGMLRAENTNNGEVIFAQFETQQDPALEFGSSDVRPGSFLDFSGPST